MHQVSRAVFPNFEENNANMSKKINNSRFDDEFRNIAKRDSENKNASLILQHVLIPLSIAALGVSSGFIWEFSKTLAVSLWIFLTAIYVLNWWKSNVPYSDVYRLLLHKKDDEDKIQYH